MLIDYTEVQLQALMEAIYQRYSYDFRDYSAPSQRRRLNHALGRLHCASLDELQRKVLKDAGAFGQLLQMLTVPVTEMFRDPAFFLALREQVVPVLKTYPSPKIWVAGCCTGEEALSLAIILHEEGLLERSLIYATDINPVVLDKARLGVYPPGPTCRLRRQLHGRRRPGQALTITIRWTMARRVSTAACWIASILPTTAWLPTACLRKRS